MRAWDECNLTVRNDRGTVRQRVHLPYCRIHPVTDLVPTAAPTQSTLPGAAGHEAETATDRELA